MKIDKTKLKKNSSEVPGDCGWLIEKLNSCSDEELLPVLQSIESWSYGKCELHHWVNVLDRFDSILANATKRDEDKWILPCDLSENDHMQELVVWVLYFTTLLVEHSFSRHLYSSVEHLNTLMSSSSMTVVLSVLNLLYMFSKRSNFITRLASAPRQALLSRLIHLAESWGGKENGFGLAQCCQNLPLSSFPDGAATLHFEFYGEQKIPDGSTTPRQSPGNFSTNTIHISNIQSISKSPAQIMEELLEVYIVPIDKQMLLFTHLRLAHSFARFETRLQSVQARLQAISILVYCNSLQDNAYTVLYSGLLDEFVDVLEIKDTNLTEIKAATLRTLTSIIHLERLPNFPKLATIIDVTGAFSYHGFLPVLVRSCISTLTSSSPVEPNPFPTQLATSLFSFLYHLASFEAGGEALVSCGMMESLLAVVTWVGTEPDHITFVTRAVRVIDLITNLDMNAFQTHGGLNIFIKRLELEVNECRKEQPFIIKLPAPLGADPPTIEPTVITTGSETSDSEMPIPESDTCENSLSPMDVTEHAAEEVNAGASTSKIAPDYSQAKTSQTCLPQRAALLKSMLNFLKKDIQDPGFSESMRHLMESSLPSSLKHIISNAEYYGPSLFLLATDVVTVYVFGEPSLLSSLQDNGLTDVVLHALLVKDVPSTREVLASLPNVFSALCLNSRGLAAFVACKPFERLFKVLLSPDYLPAMRRRRSSDPMGDTASNLGNAMDELMRHQPSLKPQAMIAIVKLLEEVCLLGSDTHYICWKTPPKSETSLLPQTRQTNDNSSDEEEEEEEERETGATSIANVREVVTEQVTSGDKRAVPLVDYVLNVMKFVDAILSNNSTDDHCKEFVAQKGLVPLLGILGLPNLPIDFHGSLACQAVASVCKSILNLAHESGILQQGLQCLNEKLEALAPLHEPLAAPGGSVLLRELASASNPSEATASFPSTPLLHTLGAIHAYIMMLVHVCRTGQMDIRQVSMKQWGTELGLKVLAGLTKLYTSLVWESTVLLALCSDDALPAGCLFAKEDTLKLLPPDLKTDDSPQSDVPMDVGDSGGIQLPMEGSTAAPATPSPSDTSSKTSASHHQMKLIKPLLSAASRLGKSLAELFGLLVKLCVGSPLRQRRGQQLTPPQTPPSPAAVAVASALSNVLYAGLSWVPPPSSPLPKFRLTFLICSVRFNNPMLFDDKKMPYHLMLQHFVKSNGLRAFFEIFNWAIMPTETKKTKSSSNDALDEEFPDGTGEFLDTWLFLLEKLVNPKTMLDSPHSMPSKIAFCPLKFLIKIHKMAFDAVLKLWNKKPLKTYGVKISESVLVILCSILKGETIIAERLAKEKTIPPAPSSVANSTIVTPAPTIAGDVVASVQPIPAVDVIPSVAGMLPIFLVPTSPSLAPRLPSLDVDESPSIPDPQPVLEQPDVLPPPPSSSSTDRPSVETAAPVPVTESPVQHPYLQALLDMGFSQDRCLEAITHSHTLEQATEYLLTNTVGSAVEGDMDYSEEDHQWLAAVALSLRENLQPTTIPKISRDISSFIEDDNEEPLSKIKLDNFTATVLDGCLSQLDVQPQLVYKVCELLTTCVTRNGSEWRTTMLRTLITQIKDQGTELSLIASQGATVDTTTYMCSSTTALKFGVRLHLVTLLFEEMKSRCVAVLNEVNLVELLVELLCSAQDVMSSNPQVLVDIASKQAKEETKKNPAKDNKTKEIEANAPTERPYTPKWLAPAMLLLDLHEKLSVALKRKAEVKKVTNHIWKWFDVSAIKWYSYNPSNNKTIDNGYWSGETSIRIVNGRKKYTIHYHSMLQINEETGNRRPIMIGVSEKLIGELKKKSSVESEVATDDEGKPPEDIIKEPTSEEMEGITENQQEEPLELTKPKPITDSEKMEFEELAALKEESEPLPLIDGFDDAHKERMIRSCVGYMNLGVEPDTLDALMRLCLRITREWHLACLFSNLGGIKTLLSLTQESSFWGIQNLAAILMRHVLEEPSTLKHTMKKVVRYTAGSSSGVGAKELHSLLRLLAPAACRDTEMFVEISKQCLRIDLSMAMKRNLMTTSVEDSILMKSVGSKSNPLSSTQNYSQLSSSSEEPQLLINDLLESLATTDEEEPSNSAVGNSGNSASNGTPTDERPTGFSSLTSANRHMQLSRSSSANDMVVQEMDEQSPMESDGSKVLGAELNKITEDSSLPKKKKALLSKSTLCKLLAEFVRSYAGVAKLITDHQYPSGINDKITEECSALGYLLDQLVCGNGEQEIVNHVRALIAALASCNHAPDAQSTLVGEVKSCLSRVMCLPETSEKHSKIQALVGLISTMMDACPSQLNQPVNNCLKQQLGMNNMIRIMIKKSLIIDLARIPHCLDLSSPNMAATVNAALKPLETVLRIINLPSFVPLPISKKKNSPPDDQAQPSGTCTTNSEATRAQGEDNTEDADNTEHDISTAGESLEPSSEANPNEDGTIAESDEAGLDEILDQLLDDPGRPRSRTNLSTSQRDNVTATVTYLIGHEPPGGDTDDTLHDSRMVSHSESQFLNDNEGNEENDDSSSSEDNDNEDEVEDDDDDDDDDDADDDDDDEEDEEDGSVFDEGYDDLEEAFIRLPDERDSDDILLLPSYQQYMDTIDTIIFGDRLSYPPQSAVNDDSIFLTSTPSATNSTANVIPNHPLFQNPRDVAVPTSTRIPSNRSNRQRGVLRLLGQTHREVLQLTMNLREATQLFVSNPDARPLSDHDEILDSSDFGGQYFHSSSRSTNASLPSVPNALTRWMEEARVLESDSLHDAVTQTKPQLLAVLEKHRDVEQAERDKKKREQDALKVSNESKNVETAGDKTASVADSLVTNSVVNTSAASVVPTSGSISNSTSLNTMISALQQHSSLLAALPPRTGQITQLASVTTDGAVMPLMQPDVTAYPEFSSSNHSTDVTEEGSDSTIPSIENTTPILSTEPPSQIQVLENTASLPSCQSEPLVAIAVTSTLESYVDTAVSASSSQPVTTISSESEGLSASPNSLMPVVVPPPSNLVGTAPSSTSSEEAMSISPPDLMVQMIVEPNSPTEPTNAPSSNEAAANPLISEVDDLQPQNLVIREEMQTTIQNSGAHTSTVSEPPVTDLLAATNIVQNPIISAPSSSGPIRSDFTSILGDLEIPEGVDPSFLAALPEEMRKEVISEQLRIQRVRERAVDGTQESTSQNLGEVNPEFLAALPPSIQEEVLAQQRIEQQRQQAATANPDDPVSFLQTLPQGLRQSILSDLEDSQFSALPPDVAQEAQSLRRQREDRNRHVQHNMLGGTGGSTISNILRSTARLSSRLLHSPSWGSWNVRSSSSAQPQLTAGSKVKGQQLLDHESMTCLLVLLFVDEPKLHTNRLHRVLKSLCHHPPTREWVVKTLLSIIERCNELGTSTSSNRGLGESEMSGLSLEMTGKGGEKNAAPLTSTPIHNWKSDRSSHQAPWLSMTMDAALGCRASIFQIQRSSSTGKKTPGPSPGTSVHIHPQAAPLVCRHSIDLLISLAKTFPSHFLPTIKECEERAETIKSSGAVPKGNKPAVEPTEFWDLLIKLDSISVSRKGKGLPRTHLNSNGSCDQDNKVTSLETSPLGQLIQQLAHPVIKRSSLLTDRLLRLLALVSLGHPDTADAPVKPDPSSSENTKALELLLGLAIEVLTSKSCSEEGLEDATALLLHLSHGPPPARDLVLKLLLQGATTLGETVAIHISSLLKELKAFNESHPRVVHEEETIQPFEKGLLKDRFTSEHVVIESSSKVKPPCEVQLPSMSILTSKTSSQAFFLRTLKVIIQLRDAIRLAKNRKSKIVKAVQAENISIQLETRLEPVPPVHPLDSEVPVLEQEPVPSSVSQSETTESSSQSTPELSSQESSVPAVSQLMDISHEVDPALTVPVEPTEPNVEAMEVESRNSEDVQLQSLSFELSLESLWTTLSHCLVELGDTADTHAVLVLQPTVEAFFLVHASTVSPDKKVKPVIVSEGKETQLEHLQHDIAPLSPLPASQTDYASGTKSERENISNAESNYECDSVKFLKFAETHRSVLNQILRQSSVHLADGPFSVLVDHTRLLDFDIKRKYFRTELERADDGMRREDLAVHVRREHVFEDSFREIHRRSSDEWKNRFYIVFEGEEGQDAGGLLREWYVIISREIFNPMYALFCTSPGDRVTYMINPSSHCNSNHLSYFKFVGRVIAKAIYDNKLLECYFTRSFYKHILGKMVRVADMESEDYAFYQGLIYLLEHRVADLGYELTFSTEVQEFGVTEARDLKQNGRNIPVTEESKMEYIRLVCQEKMTGAIKRQLNSFLEGFYDIIPKRLISIFNEQELELLLSGLPTIDIDDLKSNTEYHKYNPNSLQIQWFWRALRSFDQAERAKLVQFVTGTSKVPLQGFAALEGMNGTQKFQIHRDDRSTDRLPSAHTCFNQLDLPFYETYDKLRHYLLKAIQECSEGFGFA